MNLVVLNGRLTRDPELKFGQSGKAYSRFSIAVDRPFQSSADKNSQTADFINCVAFGKTAEFIGEYFRKGRKILLNGRLQMSQYESEGKKITTYVVIADSVEFGEAKASSGSTLTIYRGATLVFTDGNPISGLTQDPLFHGFGQGDIAGLPVPAITMFLAFIILWFVLSRTSLGRKTYAVGGSEKVSYIAGIKIDRVKIFVYALTGMLCGIAGAIITSRLNSAQPTAGAGYELDAIAAVVLGGTSLAGGRGHIVGTLIGALIIGTLNNGLNILDVSSFYQQVVKGIVILLAVLADRKKA